MSDVDPFTQAVQRGRNDIEFWSYFFLEERLHAGQLEWLTNAEAQVNVLATANRWGKSHVCVVRHFHRLFYKIGAEWNYLDKDGNVDVEAWYDTRYNTLHSAQGFDTVELVWNPAYRYCDKPNLKGFIRNKPRSSPPYIEFTNGSKWSFRTLGRDGRGIDGNSFYLITIDEAGWVDGLEEIMTNVAQIRTADVQGMTDIIGTFKPGISRDFYRYAKRAAIETDADIGFDFEDWTRKRAIMERRGQLP